MISDCGSIARNHANMLCVLLSGFGSECEECPFASQCILLRKPFDPKEAVGLITRKLNDRPN